MLSELLHTCGLNPTEQKLFVSLYTDGAATASLLAKRTGLKRPTIYAALGNLTQRGVVVEQKKKSSTLFVLVERTLIPSILRSSAEGQLREVIDAATRLPLYLSDLETRQRFSFGDFEVNILENIDAIYAQLAQVYESKGFSAIVNPQIAFVGKGKEITKKFLESSAKSKPQIREIVVSGPLTDWYRKNIQNRSHVLKELPKESPIASDIIIGDGFVVISHYQGRRELGMKIRHAGFHRTMLEMFDRMFASL